MSEEVLFTFLADGSGVIDVFAQIDEAMALLEDRVSAFIDQLDQLGASSSVFSELGAEAAKAGEDIAGAAGEASDRLAGLRDAVGEVGNSFTEAFGRAQEFMMGMLEFQAMNEVWRGVSEFTSNLIGMNAQMEQLHQQLLTLTGSNAAADKLTDFIRQLGYHVPDTTANLAQAAVMIQSLGVNAQDVLEPLAKLAAASGKDMVTAARSFTDAYGGNIWRMMNLDLHITKEEMEKFGLEVSKSGKVVQSSFIPALIAMSKSPEYANALTNQMNTLNGQLTNLTDRFQFFAMQMGKPIFELAKQALANFFAFLDSHQDALNAFADIFGKVITGALKDLMGIVSQLGDAFGGLIGIFTDNSDKFDGLHDVIGNLATIFRDLGEILGGIVHGTLDVLVGWVQQGTTSFAGLFGSVKQVYEPTRVLSETLQKVGGHLLDVKEYTDGVKQKMQEIQGPLQPVVDLFKDLSGFLSSVVAWFQPIPEHTDKTTTAVKKWTDTGDGMGKWKTQFVTSVQDVPEKASGFMQFLSDLKTKFLDAFGDDKGGDKIHALAQAASDLMRNFGDLAKELGSDLGPAIGQTAQLMGGLFGAVSNFVMFLQNNSAALEGFRVTLDLIAGIIAATLLSNMADLTIKVIANGTAWGVAALGNLKAWIAGAQQIWGWITNLFTGFKDNLTPAVEENTQKVQDNTAAVDNETAAQENAAPAIEATGTSAQQAATGGVNQLTTELQNTQTQAEQTGQELSGPLTNNVQTMSGEMETAASQGVSTLKTDLEDLQTQAQQTGEELSTTLTGDVQTMSGEMDTAANGGVANAKQSLANLNTEAGTVGTTMQTTLPGQVKATDTALSTLSTQGAAEADSSIRTLTTDEQLLGVESGVTLPPQMEAATTAIEQEGSAASTSAGETSSLSGAENSAGTAATGAVGSSGGGGFATGVGFLGLFALIDFGGTLLEGFAKAISNLLKQFWDSITSHGANSQQDTNSDQGPGYGGIATGGFVNTSGTYLVGEEGPELVSLSSGVTVFPSSVTQQMLSVIANMASAGSLTPLIAGLSAGSYSGSGNGSSSFSGTSSLVNALQQLSQTMTTYMAPMLGAQPVSAATGSVTSINGPLNFYGVQDLMSLQAQINRLNGILTEDASRGAWT